MKEREARLSSNRKRAARSWWILLCNSLIASSISCRSSSRSVAGNLADLGAGGVSEGGHGFVTMVAAVKQAMQLAKDTSASLRERATRGGDDTLG